MENRQSYTAPTRGTTRRAVSDNSPARRLPASFALRCIVLSLLCSLVSVCCIAQDAPRAAAKRSGTYNPDSIAAAEAERRTADSLALMREDEALLDSIERENADLLQQLTSPVKPEVDLSATDSLMAATVPTKQFIPNPTTATWLALVIPGGGQIYNRKYWKLPIFYGGFAGCAYALTWNNNMYQDYAAAYKDAVNENWDSNSIQDLLPAGYLSRVSTSQLTETLRTRKNRYRRYRDMSIFAFIGVYLLSVIDAYVDAELSNFDLTPDLSMSVEPTVIQGQTPSRAGGQSVGVQCNIKF